VRETVREREREREGEEGSSEREEDREERGMGGREWEERKGRYGTCVCVCVCSGFLQPKRSDKCDLSSKTTPFGQLSVELDSCEL
jgi:hypothetical protein